MCLSSCHCSDDERRGARCFGYFVVPRDALTRARMREKCGMRSNGHSVNRDGRRGAAADDRTNDGRSALEYENGNEWERRTGSPRGSPTPVLAGTQAGLTTVFGMGTGETPPLWPLERRVAESNRHDASLGWWIWNIVYEWWRRTGSPRGSPTPVLAGTQAGLTTVFGMGTGETPPLWPP